MVESDACELARQRVDRDVDDRRVEDRHDRPEHDHRREPQQRAVKTGRVGRHRLTLPTRMTRSPAVPTISAQYSLILRVGSTTAPGCSAGSPPRSARPAGRSAPSSSSRSTTTTRCATSRSTPATRSTSADRRGGHARRGRQVLDWTDRTFVLHVGGKIEQRNKHPLRTRDDLSMAYTPGVARVCTAIAAGPDKAFQYTIKRNTVAVVVRRHAVLGLGRHRARGRDAGDGGQGDALQGVRRRRRVPDLPGHQGRRGDHRHRQGASPPASAASTSRTSPRRAASRSRSG